MAASLTCSLQRDGREMSRGHDKHGDCIQVNLGQPRFHQWTIFLPLSHVAVILFTATNRLLPFTSIVVRPTGLRLVKQKENHGEDHW